MGATLDPGIINSLMNSFSFVLTGGFGRIMPVALTLLGKLSILAVIFLARWAWWTEDNIVAALVIKAMWIGGFIFLVTWWPYITNVTLQSFVNVGLKGGGGSLTLKDFTDPASIAKFGLEVTAVLFANVSRLSGLRAVVSLPMMLVDALIMVGIVVAFFLMAIQVFITLVEFYLFAMLSLILIPFGIFPHTSFIAERAFGGAVAFGIKVMVLAAIMNSAQPILQSIRLTSANPTLNETRSLLLAAWAITLLAWHAPGMAAGLMTGAPSLTASTVAHTALAAGAGVMLAGMRALGTPTLLGAATRTGLRFGGAAQAAVRAGGVRGLLQTAGATAGYHANMVTAGFRGAYASGRIYGAHLTAFPSSPGSPGTRAVAGITPRQLALRVVPPQSHPQGGISGPIRHP